jgi:HEAT repeat protein
LIGEAGYSSGKDVLLQLSYDSNHKVRSSAINSLGKIKIDRDEAEFVKKVSERLTALVNERIDEKLYNKDIAFAFSKYQHKQNLDALLDLLANNFYGARFLAADALKGYWDQFGVPDNNTLLSLESNRLAFQAFLYSLYDLPDDKFKPLVEKILSADGGLPIATDVIVNLNLIDLLKTKKSKATDETYIGYYDKLISGMESKSKLKVR